MSELIISPFTRANWERLDTSAQDRLTRRANKTRSRKRVLPLEYFDHPQNAALATAFIERADDLGLDISDLLYTVAIRLLEQVGLREKSHVRAVIDSHPCRYLTELDDLTIPNDETDFLGILYQCWQREGDKNLSGSYYTPRAVVEAMVDTLGEGEGGLGDQSDLGNRTFLDPCCGSGAFLRAFRTSSPSQLFGVDNDPVAAMIARFGLLLAYPGHSFKPQIICVDFLELTAHQLAATGLPQKVDLIATNPPWGSRVKKAMDGKAALPPNKRFPDLFSRFFVRSMDLLKEGGRACFLFPEAVLNVSRHRHLRAFMLDQTKIDEVCCYGKGFSGVLTGAVHISCQKGGSGPDHRVKVKLADQQSFHVPASQFAETRDKILCLLTEDEMAIIRQMRAAGPLSLAGSTFALGIVTGNNAAHLLDQPTTGSEPVYTGKEVDRYRLRPARSHLCLDPSRVQQMAAPALYRTRPKLVYRFITDRLTFALDESGGLCLNSANILIPAVPGMSVRTVLAFLDSEALGFFHQRLFGGLKILKGDLLQLPFPEISPELDRRLDKLVRQAVTGDAGASDVGAGDVGVDRVVAGESRAHGITEGESTTDRTVEDGSTVDEAIQELVYAAYGLGPEQIPVIKARLGKAGR